MRDLVKVLLYREGGQVDGMEIGRDEFERVLNDLFAQDQDDLDVVIGEKEIRGMTDIVLSSASVGEVEDSAKVQTFDGDDASRKAA